jgi:hypothetical protein
LERFVKSHRAQTVLVVPQVARKVLRVIVVYRVSLVRKGSKAQRVKRVIAEI